jgi:hypothetical protein
LTISRNDIGENAHVQAGAADERPIDVRQKDELVNVVGLYAAAIDDMTLIRRAD